MDIQPEKLTIEQLNKAYQERVKNINTNGYIVPFANELKRYLNDSKYAIKHDSSNNAESWTIIYTQPNKEIFEITIGKIYVSDVFYLILDLENFNEWHIFGNFWKNIEYFGNPLKDYTFEDIVLHIYNLKKIDLNDPPLDGMSSSSGTMSWGNSNSITGTISGARIVNAASTPVVGKVLKAECNLTFKFKDKIYKKLHDAFTNHSIVKIKKGLKTYKGYVSEISTRDNGTFLGETYIDATILTVT